MSNVRELVDALIAGDSVAIDNSFNTVMADKVSAALDDYRVQVARNMFNPTTESIDSTDVEEEQVDDNVQ